MRELSAFNVPKLKIVWFCDAILSHTVVEYNLFKSSDWFTSQQLTSKQLGYLDICRVSVGGGDVWLPVFGRLR